MRALSVGEKFDSYKRNNSSSLTGSVIITPTPGVGDYDVSKSMNFI